MTGRTIITGLMILAGYAQGVTTNLPPNPRPALDQADPCFPSERVPEPALEWSRWWPARIQQLKTERDRLREQISTLSQHKVRLRGERRGWHSLFEESAAVASAPAHWIEINFNKDSAYIIESVAIVPDLKLNGTGTYAFPRRFKIDVIDSLADTSETVVDWTNEEFPDPGPYPVFFSGIDQEGRTVRITIPQTEMGTGAACSAIGEVYVFWKTEDGRTGSNMALWPETTVDASGSLDRMLAWNLQYLADGQSAFGLPLGNDAAETEDFRVGLEEGEPLSDEVSITLDLGQVRPVGSIDLWPAEAPHALALPAFGMPRQVSIELSRYPGFSNSRVFAAESDSVLMRRRDLLVLKCMSHQARYVRITMKELDEYKGSRILGLGEISVSDNEQVWSIGCAVDATGIPADSRDQLPRLVDGFCQQRRILPTGEWLKGLALRRPLDRRLAMVDQTLAQTREKWQQIKRRSGFGAAGLALAGLSGGLLLQRRTRQRSMERMRWRIARDLHDEVGSSLGSISLASEQLERMTVDEVVRKKLDDLSLMAREASVSLREVIWVVDQSVIHLPELLDRLEERVRRVLQGVELEIERQGEVPSIEVSLPFKRHLIMFFKEAVHNCVRHAQASKVRVAFEVAGVSLRISVCDNGCGFDPAQASDGCGLYNMKSRAREMGGTWEVVSQPGEGTSIMLEVPLRALTNHGDHHYKTSN